jgi:hypothetical protein
VIAENPDLEWEPTYLTNDKPQSRDFRLEVVLSDKMPILTEEEREELILDHRSASIEI